jgi:hypothetical protein
MFERMRSLGPPAGAKERVLRKIEGRARVRRPLRWLALAALPATVALLVVRLHRPPVADTPQPAIVIAPAPTPPVVAKVAREPLRTDGTVRFALAHARVSAKGHALIEVGASDIRVREGSAVVDGSLLVQGPACANRVEGRARVSVSDSHVVIAMYEGRALPVADVTSCEIVAAPQPARAQAPLALEEPTPEPLPEPLPEQPSELAQLVTSYRAALALEGHDDTAALAAWQKLRAESSGGALEPEIDLRIVDTLLRLSRTDEARVAARAFALHHPESARAAEMRTLGGK